MTSHETSIDRSNIAKRLRNTCILSLALLLVYNVTARALLEWRTPNVGYVVVRDKWNLVQQMESPVDWVVLGDSSGNQGVKPSVLESSLGVKSVNLCTVGGGTLVNDAWMLDLYIRRLGSPKRVILVHVYDIWHRRPNASIFAQFPLSSNTFSSLLPSPEFTLKEKIFLIFSRNIPLYFENASLAELIQFPYRSHPRWRPGLDGFMAVTEALPQRVLEDEKNHSEFVRKNKFQVSSQNKAALERILTLSQEKGFDVDYVHSPMYKGLFDKPEFQSYFGQVKQMLLEVERRHSRFRVLLKSPVTFEAEYLENNDHVVNEAAEVFTQTIASQYAGGVKR